MTILRELRSSMVLRSHWKQEKSACTCIVYSQLNAPAFNSNSVLKTQGSYHLHRKTENSTWKVKWYASFQKIWAVIWGEAIFPLFFICSVHLDIFWGGSYSHHVRFYSFMSMHKISTQVVSQRLFEFIVYSGLLFLKESFCYAYTYTQKLQTT